MPHKNNTVFPEVESASVKMTNGSSNTNGNVPSLETMKTLPTKTKIKPNCLTKDLPSKNGLNNGTIHQNGSEGEDEANGLANGHLQLNSHQQLRHHYQQNYRHVKNGDNTKGKVVPNGNGVINGNGISNGNATTNGHATHENGSGNNVANGKDPKFSSNNENGFHYNYDSDLNRPKKIYKIVLTGGPCGGKTTGQARLCTFFENLGWKVFRVPEAATVLLGGGIKFSELSVDQAMRFQEELVRTMMQIESVFFKLAETVNRDVLVICDRGAMDASAFIPREKWEDILSRNNWNEVDIRDSRYNQIIHMVSAANGAEPFYTIEDHICRTEGIDLARELDRKAAQAWVGHPYFDVVDNSTDFETKLCRMIKCVCQKLGIDAKDRLQTDTKKVKFLIKGPLPAAQDFPAGFQDFSVVHNYMQTNEPKMQARLRKRGQKGHWSYTYTVRRPEMQGQVVEVKTALSQRDYNNMLAQKDHNHVSVFKTRRCFLLNDQYFQLDVYKDPCHPRCKGLILLETYSTLTGSELQQRLPSCLEIVKEVTGDPRYSMFNLSLKERWANNKHFCQSLAGSDDETMENGCSNESHLAAC